MNKMKTSKFERFILKLMFIATTLVALGAGIVAVISLGLMFLVEFSAIYLGGVFISASITLAGIYIMLGIIECLEGVK